MYNIDMNIIDEIKRLEKLARFKLTEQERKNLAPLMLDFIDEIKNLEKIDVSNTKEAISPFNVDSEDGLREDEIIENNSKNFLKESKNSRDGFIVLREKE